MARTATTRSASLAPEEARLADELAASLANGSFTELTRTFLQTFGAPLKQYLDELRASGIDPTERLIVTQYTPPDSDERVRDFYAPSSWPADGPRDPHA